VPTPRSANGHATSPPILNAGRCRSRIALSLRSWAALVALIDDGTISGKIANDLLPELLEQGFAQAIVGPRSGMISDQRDHGDRGGSCCGPSSRGGGLPRPVKTSCRFLRGQLMKRTAPRRSKLANRILPKKLKVSEQTCWTTRLIRQQLALVSIDLGGVQIITVVDGAVW